MEQANEESVKFCKECPISNGIQVYCKKCAEKQINKLKLFTNDGYTAFEDKELSSEQEDFIIESGMEDMRGEFK